MLLGKFTLADGSVTGTNGSQTKSETLLEFLVQPILSWKAWCWWPPNMWQRHSLLQLVTSKSKTKNETLWAKVVFVL